MGREVDVNDLFFCDWKVDENSNKQKTTLKEQVEKGRFVRDDAVILNNEVNSRRGNVWDR